MAGDDESRAFDKPQTFDRRGPEAIEPGRKGGSGESRGRSVTKDATHSDKPAAEPNAKDRRSRT